MTLRTALLPVLNGVRSILGPSGLDLRTTVVAQYVRSWTGGEDGPEVRTGSYTDTITTITPRPKVVETGETTVTVGPITPSFAGTTSGGYTIAQLNPDISAEADRGKEVFWVLTGPNGAKLYMLRDIDTSRSFRYTLTLVALDRVVPL